MKLTVKNLKGEKFEVEVDESLTVEQVKGVIVSGGLIGFGTARDACYPTTLLMILTYMLCIETPVGKCQA
jgi:hypothetical protein